MSQVDTELGWSAKSDYLKLAQTELCTLSEISGQGFTNQPIPILEEHTDPYVGGFRAFSYRSNYILYHRYYASWGNPIFVCNAGGFIRAITAIPNSTVRWGNVRDGHTSSATPYGSQACNQFDSATNLYYGTMSGMPNQIDPVIPTFSTLEDALAAVHMSSQTFYKLNAGYAVCCFADWYTPEGTEQHSPILISTDENAVKLSVDGTTEYPYVYTNIRRYDAFTFYMSMVLNLTGDLSSSLIPHIDLRQFAAAAPSKVFAIIADETFANIKVLETVDPYDEFGDSGEDAGEVDPEPDDDDIEEDDLPTNSFANAGFCRIYKPSLSQLNDLADYLWTDQTFLQTVVNHLKQIIENPIDAIISLSLVPCVPPTSSSEEVKVMFIPTGVYMPPVTNQFVEVNCGTVALKEMYGSSLDYNPYTSVQLYLPYVGIVQLDTDEVMKKTISVGYRIDVVTGVCCAYVKAGSDVLYQFSGHCSIQQPITSADFSGYVGATIAAGKLVASIAAAGAGAPEVAATLVGAPTPSISGTSSETRITERNEATGRQITAGTRRSETKTENPGASFGEVATRGISNTVGAVMNSKTIVQHSGGFSGNSGYLAAVRRPYLIVTRPRIANPEKYGQFNGRPSMIYLKLGSCTGFTQVQSIHLTGIDATNPELSEIATLLTSGVIF